MQWQRDKFPAPARNRTPVVHQPLDQPLHCYTILAPITQS